MLKIEKTELLNKGCPRLGPSLEFILANGIYENN